MNWTVNTMSTYYIICNFWFAVVLNKTLSECHASSCKRKRMDLEDASKTGLQKRVRYHMDLEVMPSGLLRIVCIPVMDHGTSYVSNVYDDSYVMHSCWKWW